MLLLCLLHLISGKIIYSKVSFTKSNSWQEITSFGSDIGAGNFSVVSFLAQPAAENKDFKVSVALYVASKWTNELLQASCEDRLKQASSVYEISVPANGKRSKRTGGRLIQKTSPQVWYFVLADCSNSLEGKIVELYFTAMNPDSNHFSVEMNGIKSAFGFGLIALLLVFGKNTFEFVQRFRKDEQITGPQIWLNCSMIFNIIGVTLYFIHLSIYEYDGKGIRTLDFLGEIFLIFHQLSFSAILIIVASGWTILYTSFPIPKLLIPTIGFVAGCHLFLLGFSWFYELPKASFSRYEGWSGIVILLFRTIMFLVFLYNLNNTRKIQQGKNTSFFYKFGVWASIYFLTMPLLVYGSFMFPTYKREFIIESLNLFIPVAVFYIIHKMLSGKGDMYKMNKVLNMLPGARSHIY